MTSEHLESLSVGDSAPPLVVSDVDRIDFVKYAGASGDFNPMHVVEPAAIDAGRESVFGPGMLTAAFVSSYVADWFGLENVARLRTRFEALLWPGDTVRVSGEIVERSVEDDRTSYEVDLVAENGDGDVLISGDATIEIDDRP
ncbi:MaoC/PaaZ C-terminal domain-containing protein [Natrarchaeobius oligotrophus]|uniref:MaoC/PaaZ C-terminal domain-containing protein n=1 Tax=Natrarchaeobius oligotrophus TaxID=3455743 RepID=UPI00267D1EF3